MNNQNLIDTLAEFYSVNPTQDEIAEIINSVLADRETNIPMLVDPTDIPKICNVNMADPTKRSGTVIPRQVAMSLMYVFSDKSLAEIGNHFRKDHSTVIHCLKRMDEAVMSNDSLITSILIPNFELLHDLYKKDRLSIRKIDKTKYDKIKDKLNSTAFSIQLMKSISKRIKSSKDAIPNSQR